MSINLNNFNKKGYTLIEILIVIAILIMVMLGVTMYQKNVIEFNKYSSDSLQSAQDARAILRFIVRELRSAKPAGNGAYPIAQAATSSLIFYSDIDSDGIQDQVRYFIATSTLQKGVIKPTGTPLVYNSTQEKITTLVYSLKNATSSPMFEYFDNTYSGTTTPLVQPINIANVRLVKVSITIDADPNRSPLPRTYSSQVMLRNLKDNL